jgi:signal transduction histidine kinase
MNESPRHASQDSVNALTLWQRLSLLFVALLLACFGAAAWLQMGQSIRQSQQVEQRLLHRLADHIAAETRGMGDMRMDDARLAAIVQRLHTTNPGIEVYVLDADGRIEHRQPGGAALQRAAVDLMPIRAFLAGEPPPILGDDPLNAGKRKVFSVAPYAREGKAPGYLYAVLQGAAFDSVARPASLDAALQIALWSVGLVAPLGALAGVAAFRLVTRPLSELTRDVEKLERQAGDGDTRTAGAAALPGVRDEIVILRGAFERLVATNARQWSRLSQQDQQRRELVASISHDLRTPLASLHGYLETLLLKSAQLSVEERDHCLRTALSQSDRVGRLAQDLLELARLELGAVRPAIERFSIVDLTLDVVQKLALAAQARGQRLLPSFLPEVADVAADIGMIERVLTNLLDNAIRHTPAGGVIRIGLAPQGERVRVEIEDSGPGFAPDVRAHLFAPNGDTPLPAHGGGLGLLIVRQIMRLHGDDLVLEDRAGAGTVLVFTLRRDG